MYLAAYNINRNMGQNKSNPFREGGDLMNDFQVKETIPQLFLTFLIKKSTNKQYLLRQLTFNELREFSDQLEKLQKRKQITHHNLTNLQIVEERAEDQMCSSFYKIYTLWQYPKKNMIDDIAIRTLQNKPYQVQQIRNLLNCASSALSLLQQKGIGHQCLTSKNVLFQQDLNVKIADPLSFGISSNLEYVLSNRYNKSIYLSPQQCQSIANQRPIINKNVYKNDVFTFGLVVLEAGLLEKQDKCYQQDCSVINYSVLSKNVSRFGDRYGAQLRHIIELMTDRNIQSRHDWISLQPIIKNVKINNKNLNAYIQNPKITKNDEFNVSNIVNAPPATIVMPPQPNFQRFFQGLPLSTIPSVSNEGGSTLRHESVIPSNQTNLYSNISSIPPYSFVSPISASNNTSNMNHFEIQPQRQMQLNSNIQPFGTNPSVMQLNFLPTRSNPPQSTSIIQNIPLNINFGSHLPPPITVPQHKDMTVTFGARLNQDPQISQFTGERIVREISPVHSPIPMRKQPENVYIAPRNVGAYQYENRAVNGRVQKDPSQKKLSSNQSIPKQNELVEVYEEFTKGSRYNGFKMNGMRHGEGTFYYQDGGRYEGSWKFNKMNGFGRLFYQSDKIAYEGDWVDDQFQGRGKLYNENPHKLTAGFDFRNFDDIDEYWEYYEGFFEEDLKNGSGKLKFSNGELFEGAFVDDMVQGEGIFFCRDGQRIHAVWMENRLIQMLN